MSHPHRPLALIILDGWGHRDESQDNAIYAANTPVFDHLWQDYPHTLLSASGAGVGLPGDQMGNSEVGHLNMGAGRVVYQEFTRVSRAIRTGSFFTNNTLTSAVDLAVKQDTAVHIFGLLSPGGVHSHEEHIQAMVELAIHRGANTVYLHAFLDGRDCPPKSAQASIESMEQKFQDLGGGQFASIIGRYYGLDRDQRWGRVEKAYRLLTEGEGDYQASSALEALEMAYQRDETDEFVKSTSIIKEGEEAVKVNDDDVVIFMNFRSDRARQLTRSFIEVDFDGFERSRVIKLANFVTLTEYKKDFTSPVAFPSEKLPNVLGRQLSALGLRQLRIAETEKYAHVTFFFNGGRDEPFEDEDRILIESPDVATYDLQPAMNAPKVASALIKAIESDKYDVIICNFANADMVGHSGNYEAAVKAVEALDNCLGRVWSSIKQHGGEMIVTADHGNAELMRNTETGQPHTAHTSNLVPFIYAGREVAHIEPGALSDIAPTMLSLIDQPIPAEMDDHLLITLK